MFSALYSILVAMPFSVCLLWTALFFMGPEKMDRTRKALTWFSAVCTVLYLCHALNFLGAGSRAVDSVWITCSTASYPLFWLYIRNLTESGNLKLKDYWVLLPSLCTGIASLFTDAGIAGKAVIFFSVLLVCIFGYRRLKNYDRRVSNYYSNLENRSPKPLISLMALLVITSMGSSVLNILGRDFFNGSALVFIPAVLFSAVLFGILSAGYRIKPAAAEAVDNEDGNGQTAEKEVEGDALIDRIQKLMTEQEFYTRPGLTVVDVASAVGSNKSYVSSSINSSTGKTFNEYVNGLRIEKAKRLILDMQDKSTFSEIGENCGFSNESSFYRNFKAITGMTPSKWRSTQS